MTLRGPPAPSAGGRWFRGAAAVVAVCLLLAIGATWIAIKTRPDAGPAGSGAAGNSSYVAHHGGSVPRKADVRSMAELVGRMSTKVDGMVDLAVKAPRRFYLERNLRLALQTPVVRVPVDVVSSLLSMGSQKRPRPASSAVILSPSSPAGGRPWLGLKLVRQPGLREFLDRMLPKGREKIPWSLMVLVLVLRRLRKPSGELHIAEHFYARNATLQQPCPRRSLMLDD